MTSGDVRDDDTYEVGRPFLMSLLRAVYSARAFHVARDLMNASVHLSAVRFSNITRSLNEEQDRLVDLLGDDTIDWDEFAVDEPAQVLEDEES